MRILICYQVYRASTVTAGHAFATVRDFTEESIMWGMKQIATTYGHAVSDMVLTSVTKLDTPL